ncbi:hypothetical protein C7M84_019568 [Penaeus vannamei]|uniref:Reverse transcriptase domain-containing protein n=1 Tax=Penaeus vannamei TaxID=6689 RepID=A0A423SEH2_PENVA|nr:hypothetical protein C7M84_019568 [Penaeus vannamei]
MSSAESSTEECIQTPERGETPVTGPWRVAEEAPPPPEDVNNLTWEHFPVIEDSPEEPQTPEEEVQEPSILSIGPHEITYKRKTTQDAEDTDTHSPLMKEVNACQHLIERVIGAIERMENIVARQDEQLTARSQGGQQLPQQSGTSQPHRSSWQGFQDHASQERRRKKRKPRKKQRKQQTQEDIRVQENAPQQREATSQPQRRRFRTQETTVEQRQDQRRNTWNPPQHYPQRNARVNRGRGTNKHPLRTSREDPTPTKVSEGESGTPAIRGTHTGGRDRGTPTRKEDTTWETDTMVGQTIKEETPSGEQEEEKEDSGKKKIQTIGHGIGGQRDALLEHKPSIPHWYVLPKTHKPLDHVTGAWPGRPVLSGCSSPTRPVDRLLTTYLTPLLDLLPERLQDTTSFLQKMRDAKRYPGAILFSFDIVSLYPSIPQEEAAYVVANFYEQNFSYVEERLFSDFNMAAPPPYLIKEGIDHVLGGTLLRFNNRFFRQGKGTAIGASVSVAAQKRNSRLTMKD